MITLTLTDDEAKAALGLLDVAVKAVGLRAADAALTIGRKIEAGLQAQQTQQAKADDLAADGVAPV